MQKKSVCVFCGSQYGKNAIYKETAESLGKKILSENFTLVYGGGNVGLMGTVARTVHSSGGEVVGVIPTFLKTREMADERISQVIEVSSMHERKQKMADISDVFIAISGGLGTMDELCEILTWSQIGIHQKPIAILNTNGYYNHLIALFDHMVAEGFVSQSNRNLIITDTEIDPLFEKIANYTPPQQENWRERFKA